MRVGFVSDEFNTVLFPEECILLCVCGLVYRCVHRTIHSCIGGLTHMFICNRCMYVCVCS